MRKGLLMFTLCLTLFLACGFQAKAMEVTQARLAQYGGYGPYGGVQTDDPEAMKRLGEMVTAIMEREPLAAAPDAAYQSVHVTLNLNHVIRQAAFVQEGGPMEQGARYMELDGVKYPCTEREFNEIVKIAESAPPRKDLIYWALQDDKGEVTAQGFSAAEGAAQTLAKMAEEAAPVNNLEEFDHRDPENLSVSFYSGDQLQFFIFAPHWLRQDSDGILYQQITPKQYEQVKGLLGAGPLTFSYPKTLTVLKAFVWGAPLRVTDAKQIRAILEPLQGSQPCNVEGGSCPMGIYKLTLDGKEYLNVDGSQIYFSGNDKYYRLSGAYSDWTKTLPSPPSEAAKTKNQETGGAQTVFEKIKF